MSSFCDDLSSFVSSHKILSVATLGLLIPFYCLGRLCGRIVKWIKSDPATQKVTDQSRNILEQETKEVKIKDSEERQQLKVLLQNSRILVLSKTVGGWGDISCGLKVGDFFYRQLGIPLKNLGISTTADSGALKVLNVDQIPVINMQVNQILKWKADLHIYVPVAEEVDPKIDIERPVRTMAISEYGYDIPKFLEKTNPNLKAYSLGFAEDTLGFFVNEDLWRWNCENSSLSSKQRLKVLAYVPKQLQRAILKDDYSETSIVKFSDRSKLYFAYAQDRGNIYSFMAAVVAMNAKLNSDAELCFFVMGPRMPSPFDSSKELLSKYKISAIEFIAWDTGKTEKVVWGSEGNKIKIVYGVLTPFNVNSLSKASEDESLCTGDQSFSDKLSVGKCFAFEVNHKKKSHEQYLSLVPEDIQGHLRYYNSDGTINPEKLYQFFYLRRTNQSFEKAYREANNKIVQTCSFQQRFERALLSFLKTPLNDTKKATLIKLPKVLKGNEIPFDKPIYLSRDDAVRLRIRDRLSELSQHADSIFDAEAVSDYVWLIRKKKAESKQA